MLDGSAARQAPDSRFFRLATAVVLALLIAAATGSLGALADADHAADLAVVTGWVAHLFSGMTWPVVACLVAVSLCHHLAASAATRAAAGSRLPLLELLGVQYAGAAANRVTPAGLGAAGIAGRFLTRRGRLTTAQAAAAVAALALLGGLADAAALAALIGVGAALGLRGTTGETPLLVSRLGKLVPVPSGTGRWLLLLAGVVVAALVAIPAIRRSNPARRVTAPLRELGGSLLALAGRPRGLAGMVAASGATTLVLAAGFASAAILGPAALPPSRFAALMIGYMVAAAAANAVPTPGGIGAADAALTGVLVAAHAPASAALATALAYRLVTFWAPAVFGAAMLRPLRRRGAI